VLAHICVWLFVFAVPWEDMLVLTGLGTIGKLLGITAFGATTLHVLLRGRVRTLNAFHGAVVLFMCWVLLSTFWSVAEPLSIQRKVLIYVQNLVMLWVIWETTASRGRLASLFQAYVLGGYVAAISTIRNYLTGAAVVDYERFAAQGFDANDLGMLLALGLPMAWYLASTGSSGFQRWLNRIYFIIATLGILLTGSRGALITTIVALSVIPLTLSQMRRSVRIAGIVVIILAAVAAVRFVPEESFERLSTTTTEISEGNLTGRIAIWQSGLRAVPKRPLQGFGPGGWYRVAGRVGVRLRSSHNTYLSILVEEGMIGLVLYLLIFVVLLRRLRRLPVFEGRVGLTLLATLATAILPLGWDTRKALWLVLALLVALSDVFVRMPLLPPPARAHRPPLRRPGGAPASAAVE
jgi:O-antigen ligase